MGISVGQILRQAALRTPNAVALVDVGRVGRVEPHTTPSAREWTYAQLDAWACAVARELRELGVSPGDRVALLADNSAEVVAAWFGIVYAGAAVVPLHVASVPLEIGQRLAHAGCKWLLHDQPRARLAQEGAAHAAALSGEPAAPSCATRAVETFAHAPREERSVELSFPIDAGVDLAMVLYTSGTTGKAKGAAITHASLLLHTTTLVREALALGPDDTVLCVLPLSHSYGCRLALLAPFFAGARVLCMPRFDAARSLELMNTYGVTWVPAVPTMFAAWGEHAAAPKPGSLRWALSAGAPLADEIAKRAEAVLGVTVRQGYGMTEATFTTLNAPPHARVFGSVGKPVWGVEVRVVDAQGRDAPPGHDGEVIVRGHNVMSRYLFDPEATQDAQVDGFFHSGDIGRFDDEGLLYIVDRVKDLVIRGGYNVYPSEVEDALCAHPGVAQAAVIGRPDAFYGEEIVAVIVPRAERPTLESLVALVAERLSPIKRPREYAFVDAMPLGPSGKVHKRTLRERAQSGALKLEVAPQLAPKNDHDKVARREP